MIDRYRFILRNCLTGLWGLAGLPSGQASRQEAQVRVDAFLSQTCFFCSV